MGTFHFPIFRFNQVQCLMTPDLFLVPSTFSGMMFLSRGARAIFCSRTNFLLMKVPSAPESIRAFILNRISTFLLSPCTSNGTINDFLFSFTSSTGEIEMESGAGASVEVGRSLKTHAFEVIGKFVFLVIGEFFIYRFDSGVGVSGFGISGQRMV